MKKLKQKKDILNSLPKTHFLNNNIEENIKIYEEIKEKLNNGEFDE